MKRYLPYLIIICFVTTTQVCIAQQTSENPWKENQLMAAADLAAILNNTNAEKPVILSIGPSAYIKGSIDVGAAKDKENVDKLKAELSKLAKDANIIIYCGCCPFEHCPNIRPAFNLLAKMKFTNYKLLNLEHNIKIDWINKGYPRN